MFSVVQNIWNNERNFLKDEIVKVELLVHLNYNMTSIEAANCTKCGSGKELAKVATMEKYKV
jgi:hypothetical protein